MERKFSVEELKLLMFGEYMKVQNKGEGVELTIDDITYDKDLFDHLDELDNDEREEVYRSVEIIMKDKEIAQLYKEMIDIRKNAENEAELEEANFLQGIIIHKIKEEYINLLSWVEEV